MLTKIKELCDKAVALQNKNYMEEVLKEISFLCDQKPKEVPKVEKVEKVVEIKSTSKAKEKAK